MRQQYPVTSDVHGGQARERKNRRRRRSCTDLARRQARRRQRARKGHRMLFWLLFLMALAQNVSFAIRGWFTSRSPSLRPKEQEHVSEPVPEAAIEDSGHTDPFAFDTGLGRRGSKSQDYLPPLSLGDAEIAHAIKFLIRAKGGKDGPIAKRMWRTLDQASMPLALYLRDVKERGDWLTLRNELKAQPVPRLRPALAQEQRLEDKLTARIMGLMPGWRERGEGLFRTMQEMTTEESSPAPKPPIDKTAEVQVFGIH